MCRGHSGVECSCSRRPLGLAPFEHGQATATRGNCVLHGSTRCRVHGDGEFDGAHPRPGVFWAADGIEV